MNFLKYLIPISCLFITSFVSAQQALKDYETITAAMEASFPVGEYKTFRRESFSEQQLQTYLSQHYTRLDLLPLIDGHYALKMHSYLHAGNWFREVGFPKESIKWYNVLFKYYNTYADKLNIAEKNKLLENMSYSYSIQTDNYARIGKLDSAAVIHKQNIKFVKDYNNIYHPSAYNNYGIFFYKSKNNLDSALIYFNKAYKITLDNFPNNTLIGSIRDNMADVYINKNQPEIALPLYKANFEMYSNIKNEISGQFDVPRLISAGTQQVLTEIKLNQLAQAERTFQMLQNIIRDSKVVDRVHPSSKLEILKVQEALYFTQNNFEMAYTIAVLRNNLTDSLNGISKLADNRWQEELNAISLDRVTLNFKIDRIEKENKITGQRLRLWIISILSLAIIGTLVALFFRRQGVIMIANSKRLLAEQNLKLFDLENKQLQSEIASKKRDLSDFAISLTQNQEWAKELANKIKYIKTTDSIEQEALMLELKQDIQNKIIVDSDTQEFHERLHALSDSFYSVLTEHYQNLSKNEVRLCSLIRLKMDGRSIATLQNITIASLNTSRYRLRKKLNLKENVDLDDFVQSL
jgi:tetratricopeptide (TPR) repeat protein